MKVAVVDIGSNSLRLFLCTGLRDGQPEGERTATVTALRRGAAPDGTVTDDALDRLDACLATYGDRIREFAPETVVAVGTSAVRDAPNRDAIAARVTARLSTELVVLTGSQEAEMSFVGARLVVAGDDEITVMDVGGGSTELVCGGPDGPRAAVSLDVGAVRCTDALLPDDPPTPEQQAAVTTHASEQTHPVFDALGRGRPMVGVAGTITTLASIELGAYDPKRVHGFVLTRATVATLIARLGAMTEAERREVPGLDPARASVIVAGACVVLGAMDAGGIDSLTVSERDLLDGVALRLSPLGG